MLKEGLYEELISEKLEGELAVLEDGKYYISKEKNRCGRGKEALLK